jgi:alkylhydroperoxidase/carboxymuconolactone decarboxylase family protein YurZ
MSTPTGPAVDDATASALTALALGRTDVLGQAEDEPSRRGRGLGPGGLGPRGVALVKIAALVAIDAPPASYLWQVGAALDAGVTPRDILGILAAVAPQVGLARVVAAAPEIMVALGLELPGGLDG